jgi:signal peptidase I
MMSETPDQSKPDSHDMAEQENPAPEGAASPVEPAAAIEPSGEDDAPLHEDATMAAAEGDPEPHAGEVAEPAAAATTAAAKADAGAGEEKKADEEGWLETIKTVVYALLIALVIRTFLFQPFNIPSGSMENTLLIGDYLFVEKYAYGYSRYSFPWGLGPLGDAWHGRMFESPPKRGDVVVFRLPSDPSVDYIKRVIGLPGDRIQMIDDRLYINGKVVPQKRVSDYIETIDGYQHHVPRYEEFLPNGRAHYILDRDPDGPSDNTGVYIVPPHHYFMMGDNRDNSDDSRAGVGYVPAENLVGKAEFIFFSTNGKAHFWEFWEWPWAIRWNRIFTVID